MSRTRRYCARGGNLQLQQLFDRKAIAEVVRHRTEVVDAIGHRNDLLVELRLAGLLDAGVEEADVGHHAQNGLAVDLEHQAEHAMRRRVLRAHVQDHGAIARTFFQARFEQRRYGEVWPRRA